MKKLLVSLSLFATLVFGQAVSQSPQSLTATAIQELVAQDETYVATQNANALAKFNQDCTTWTVNNIRNRDLKLPLTTKPPQPTALHFTSSITLDGQSATTAFSIGPDQLGKACPDLPSATLPANNVQVGQSLGGGWFGVGIQDTVPYGQPVQANGHTYVKYGAPVGNSANSDGSIPGWYYQIQ